MKIKLNTNKTNASKKAATVHPELPAEVIDDIVTLLYNKSNAHKAISNYIQALNKKRKELIEMLDKSPYLNKLGSVTVHTRYNISLTDKEMEELKAFCKKNDLDVTDLIEVKVKYLPTPVFRNILLSQSDDLFMPLYEKIKCEASKVLHVRLSL